MIKVENLTKSFGRTKAVDDLSFDDGIIYVVCAPNAIFEVRDVLCKLACKVDESVIGYSPKSLLRLNEEDATKGVAFLEIVEGLEDVQRVYANI